MLCSVLLRSLLYWTVTMENKKTLDDSRVSMVGVAGFEPATFWSRTKRATKLRYTPVEPIKGLEPLT